MNKKKILDKKWFKDKKVVVFGIGLLGGGVSAIKFLSSSGAQVIATDIKSKEELKKSLVEIKGLKNVTLVLGQHRREDFEHSDMIIKTPGCPWTNEYIKLALKNKIPVETDASLFLRLCKNKVIGITGTKGKTTVSHMTSHFLKSSGYHTIQVGVGITPVLDRLSLLKKNTVVVFEFSSWRLSALKYAKVSPHISIFTSFFPDHMNYYHDMATYWTDKEQIFKFQKKDDFLIFNADDESIFSKIQRLNLNSKKIAVTFSNDNSRDIFVENDIAFINVDGKAKKIANISDMQVMGTHNKINMLLALGAVRAIGASESKLAKAVKSFRSIKYRLEHIRTLNGVEYYNDTAATNPGASIAAINTFKDRNIILLAGGAEKNLATDNFAMQIAKKVKKVFFFKGEYSEKLISEMKKMKLEKDLSDYKLYDSMKEILQEVRTQSQEKDIVLLSPGASSFSMYKNEFERGDDFILEVEKLKK